MTRKVPKVTIEEYRKYQKRSMAAGKRAEAICNGGYYRVEIDTKPYLNFKQCYVGDLDIADAICKILNTDNIKLKFRVGSHTSGGYGHRESYTVYSTTYRAIYINDKFILKRSIYSSTREGTNYKLSGFSEEALYRGQSIEEMNRKIQETMLNEYYRNQINAEREREIYETEIEKCKKSSFYCDLLGIKWRMDTRLKYFDNPEIKELFDKLEKECVEKRANSKSNEDKIYISKEDLERLVNETLNNKQSKTLKKTLTK